MLVTRFLFVMCLLFNSAVQAISPADLPQSFTANYELFRKGLSVAETSYQFSKTELSAELMATTKLTGLAAIFSDEQVTERSQMSLNEKEVQVTLYKYKQTGSKPLNIISEFDADNKTIKTTINDQSTLTNYQPVTWDKLSNFIALMSSAKKTDKNISLQTLDRNQVKKYQLELTGQREIELYDDEWIKTVIWQRFDGHKKVVFYLDPRENFLPVKIQQYKHNKLRATLLLKTIQWH